MILKIDRAYPLLKLVFAISSRVSNQVVALVVTLVAATRLGPEEFGVFALASAFVIIVRTLLYSATFQYMIKTSDIKLYSSECLAVSFIMAVIMSMIALAILSFTELFGDPAVLTVFVVLAPSNVISAIAAWEEAQILRSGAVSRYYGITGAVEIFAGVLTILLLWHDLGIIALVIQIYVRAFALLVAYNFLIKPTFSTKLSLERTWEIAKWAFPQYLSMMSGLLSNYGADFIIGAVLSPAATGIYRAASRVTSAASDICGQPLRTIAMTNFSRRAAVGLDVSDLFPQILGVTILLIVTVMGGLAAVAEPAMGIVFGSEWPGVEQIVAILCLGKAASTLTGIATPLLVSFGRHKTLLPVQLVATTTLLFGLLLLAKEGVVATAWVTSFSLAAACLIYLALAYQTAKSRPDHISRYVGSALLPSVTSTIVAGAVCYFLEGHLENLWRMLVAVGAAFIAWLVCVWFGRTLIGTMFAALRDQQSAVESLVDR